MILDTPVPDHPEACSPALDARLVLVEEALPTPLADVETTILVGHHPLFVDAADEPDSYWNVPGVRRRPLLDLIERSGVRLGLAGHLHRNATARAGSFGMVTSGAVGYPLGDDPSGFRVVRVRGSRIEHARLGMDMPFPGSDAPGSS